MVILWTIVIGFIVGLLARAIYPGKDTLGLLWTILLGIGGSTSFWDAASFGLVETQSTHIVVGEFSSKFAEVTRAVPVRGSSVRANSW